MKITLFFFLMAVVAIQVAYTDQGKDHGKPDVGLNKANHNKPEVGIFNPNDDGDEQLDGDVADGFGRRTVRCWRTKRCVKWSEKCPKDGDEQLDGDADDGLMWQTLFPYIPKCFCVKYKVKWHCK